jgi:pimeloyl-ACP methyl ester carboxylesterase
VRFDDIVVNGGCSVAVRDHGGTGAPILLLHGLGRNLADWSPIAHKLTANHRVVAMDFRSHGYSAESAWDWEAVNDDIRRVIKATDLDRPALVGHSLGGMTAAMFSARGGETRCVVNLDGFGSNPDFYLGIPRDAVRRHFDERWQAAMAARPDASGPLTSAGLSALWATAETGGPYGNRGALEVERLERALHRLPDATFTLKPSIARLNEIADAISDIRWFDLFGQVCVPFLIYNCVAGSGPGRPAEGALDMTAAYRRGIHQHLVALAEQSQNVRIRTLDTHHMLILSMPDELADGIHQFVESHA